jgi:hypothetical protein
LLLYTLLCKYYYSKSNPDIENWGFLYIVFKCNFILVCPLLYDVLFVRRKNEKKLTNKTFFL